MFLSMVTLILAGLIGGIATAAGVIALLTKLGVVPRMIGRFQVANAVIPCECTIIVGAVTGCLFSIFGEPKADLLVGSAYTWQKIIITMVGLGSGVYVGCQAMALAEILNVFPILFRRAKLQEGLRFAIFAIALGKMVGSIWYFVFGYQSL